METSHIQGSIGTEGTPSIDPDLLKGGEVTTAEASFQSNPSKSTSISIPGISRPANHIPSASTGAVPTQAALQAAGILPPKVGEPSRPPTPPSKSIPIATTTAHQNPNEISSPLPFSTSVPYARTNFNDHIHINSTRPLSSDEIKSLSFSKAQQMSNHLATDESNELQETLIEPNSIPAEALFPSPSGGFVPPPDVDGQEWKLKDAPKALARGGPIQGEPLEERGIESSKSTENAKDGPQVDRSQTPRGSAMLSTTKRDSVPPTRPPSLPASAQTAELIATAPSSSTSRRNSQASPSLRPISTNSLGSLSLSRTGSNDKRRKSGLSTNSSNQLSPTENTDSKRQSFNLNDNQIAGGSNSISPINLTSPSPFGNSRSNSTSKEASSSRRASKSLQPQSQSSDAKMMELNDRPFSSSSTHVSGDQPSVISPTSIDAIAEASTSRRDSTRNSTFSSTSLPPEQQHQSNPSSSRHSKILPPLKIRDFAFPETDPRHVGARDLSIPEERLSTGYGGQYGLSGSGEDEEEWGPEAHEHSYEDGDEEDEEGTDGEDAGLPEGLYQVVYPFDAESEHELSVVQGQKVQVVGALEGGWAIVQTTVSENGQIPLEGGGEGEGSRGLVPEAYLEWLGPL